MSDDIIDFTMLAKKGILQRSRDIENRERNAREKFAGAVNNEGFVDLTNMQSQGTSNTPSAFNPPSPSDTGSNPFASFFGAVDSGNSSFGSSVTPAEPSVSVDKSEVNALRIKLEDTEFKLERALERVAQIEMKLLDFERRVGN